MTSFINPDFPTEHRGVARIEAVVAAVQRLRGSIAGARGLAAMLIAGAISALVLVADQIVGTWTDEHLLMAWVALWVAIFVALALFAGTARDWSVRMKAALKARSRAAAARAADERTWAIALTDPRLMADLQMARLRAERDAEASGEPMPDWPFADVPTQSMSQRQLFRTSDSSWSSVNQIASASHSRTRAKQ